MSEKTTMPRLETERLLLRPFCLYDVKAYFNLVNDPNVLSGTHRSHSIDEASIREWVINHPTFWNDKREAYLLISLKETHEVVGSTSLFTCDFHSRANLGYSIVSDRWGNGYATEAAAAVIKYAFEELKLHKLEAYHHARNPLSGRVLEKIGFQQEGIRQEACFIQGIFEDLYIYGLLREKYKARAPKAQGSGKMPYSVKSGELFT